MDELSNPNKRFRYQTYLVTCWQERDDVTGTTVRRFRVETPRTSHYTLFITLEEVMSFIETELRNQTRSNQ